MKIMTNSIFAIRFKTYFFSSSIFDVFDDSEIFDSTDGVFLETEDHFLRLKRVFLYICMVVGLPANFIILYVSFTILKFFVPNFKSYVPKPFLGTNQIDKR